MRKADPGNIRIGNPGIQSVGAPVSASWIGGGRLRRCQTGSQQAFVTAVIYRGGRMRDGLGIGRSRATRSGAAVEIRLFSCRGFGRHVAPEKQ